MANIPMSDKMEQAICDLVSTRYLDSRINSIELIEYLEQNTGEELPDDMEHPFIKKILRIARNHKREVSQ